MADVDVTGGSEESSVVPVALAGGVGGSASSVFEPKTTPRAECMSDC